MSPVIEPTRPSTVLLAWLRVQGEDDEHAVPEPLGDTYSVVWTAALAPAALRAPTQRADETSPKTDSHTEGLVRVECAFVASALSAWPVRASRGPSPPVRRRRDRMAIRRAASLTAWLKLSVLETSTATDARNVSDRTSSCGCDKCQAIPGRCVRRDRRGAAQRSGRVGAPRGKLPARGSRHHGCSTLTYNDHELAALEDGSGNTRKFQTYSGQRRMAGP